MKLRFAVVLLLSSISMLAADVSGKWTVGETRAGQKPPTFIFKVEGATLTGTFTNNAGEMTLIDGVVNGDTITFSIIADKKGAASKMNYVGKVAGDEISMTHKREGGTGEPKTAKLKRATN